MKLMEPKLERESEQAAESASLPTQPIFQREILALLYPEYADPDYVQKIHKQAAKDLAILTGIHLIIGSVFVLLATNHMYEQQGVTDLELKYIITTYAISLLIQSAIYTYLRSERVVNPRYKMLENLRKNAIPAEINPVQNAIINLLFTDSTLVRLGSIIDRIHVMREERAARVAESEVD